MRARHKFPADGHFGSKADNGHTNPVIDEGAQGRVDVTGVRREESTKDNEDFTRTVRRGMAEDLLEIELRIVV